MSMNNSVVYLPIFLKIKEEVLYTCNSSSVYAKVDSYFWDSMIEQIFNKIFHNIVGRCVNVVEDENEVYSDFGGRKLLKDIIKIVLLDSAYEEGFVMNFSKREYPRIKEKIKKEMEILISCDISGKKEMYKIIHKRLLTDMQFVKEYMQNKNVLVLGELSKFLLRDLIVYTMMM